MRRLARVKKKRRAPRWLHVKLPKIISAKDISGLREVEKVGSGTGTFTGAAVPSVKLENDKALPSALRKGLIHNDPQISSTLSKEIANEKINMSNWGENIFIDRDKIKESMRYYVGGELAEKSQINDLLVDFQYLIHKYSGYGFPSIMNLFYDENEKEWGYHQDDNTKKKIEPDALLDKIFSVLAVYRLSFTILERHQTFDKTVVLGMLSLLEPLLFVKKSLANNEMFKKQLERINLYLNLFYKIAILNKAPDDCPKEFLSLVASVMHLMDNLDFSTMPKSVMKKADPELLKFLDDMEIPFRGLSQVDLIHSCLDKATQKNLSAKNFKDPQSPGAVIARDDARKLKLFANELIYHRKFMNYNVKRAALWIYDYIIKQTTDDSEDCPDGCQGGQCQNSGNMPGAVIGMDPDDFSPGSTSSDLEKMEMEGALSSGGDGDNALQGKFESLKNSADFDFLDPDMIKAISDFIDSMKKDTGQLGYRKMSTSRVVDSGLNLNQMYRRPTDPNAMKTAGFHETEFSLSEIDLKKFYEKNRKEIHFIKNTLGKLCNRYIVRKDKEGEINRSRLMRLIYDTLNGEEGNNYRKNKKEGIFAHITIIRDVSGSTSNIQDRITDTCLKFTMAADLIDGIFVRVIDFRGSAETRKEFKDFVPSKMQIDSGGGTVLGSALRIMEENPGEMFGTHFHLTCIMSDFCLYDETSRLAQTLKHISRYSKHSALLNVAFEERDTNSAKSFTEAVQQEGTPNVSYEVITKDRDIATILSELVHKRLIAIIRGRV